MISPEEKKDRRIAALVSLGVNSLLLILFFFLLAWQEPDPPLPEYGIELNFGLDETGAGETARPEPTPVVEEEPVEEEVTEEVEEVEDVLETPPEEVQEEPTEQVEYEAPVEESPDVVEEVTETAPEVIEEPEEPVQEPEPGSLYPSKNTNQGASDQPVGDQGKEEGKVDERALYGAKGPSDGASLQMAGWNWDYIPRPQDNSNENGRIVFQITIDDRGEIISIRTLEKTVSPAVERVYREAVEELTFSRNGENVRAAATSTGKISFVIRSK